MTLETNTCINVSEFLGKRTLIMGDVNTGKTSLSRVILEAMCHDGLADRIAVIDLAPEIPEAIARAKGLRGVGGRLLPPEGCNVIYLSAPLEPPRLSSKTDEEALEKARQNALKIEKLFAIFQKTSREILFVNDVTLYLQAKSAEGMVQLMQRAKTIVANGYYGLKLGGGTITQRERHEMESLQKFFEKTIST